MTTDAASLRTQIEEIQLRLTAIGRDVANVRSLIRRKHQLTDEEQQQCSRLSLWTRQIFDQADALTALLAVSSRPQEEKEAEKACVWVVFGQDREVGDPGYQIWVRGVFRDEAKANSFRDECAAAPHVQQAGFRFSVLCYNLD